MAIITSPLHCDGATGKIAKTQIFRLNKGVKFASIYYFPGSKKKYTPNIKQIAQRAFYQEGASFWTLLSESKKNTFRDEATGKNLSGYNFFMREYLGIFSYALLGKARLGILALGKEL